jgi:hypothetical protein
MDLEKSDWGQGQDEAKAHLFEQIMHDGGSRLTGNRTFFTLENIMFVLFVLGWEEHFFYTFILACIT